MVTRSLGLDPTAIKQANQALGQTRSVISSTILPTLGLSAAFAILHGGVNNATSSGQAASSVMFGLRVSMYELQELLTRLLLPALEEIVPHVQSAVEWFIKADEATDGWSTKLALALATLVAFRGPIGTLINLIKTLAGLKVAAAVTGAVAGGAAAGGAGAAAGAGAAGLGGLGSVGLGLGLGAAVVAGNTPFNPNSVLPPSALPPAQVQGAAPIASPRGVGVPDQYTPSRELSPQPTSRNYTTNNFYIQAHDIDELTRRIRSILEQGAILEAT